MNQSRLEESLQGLQLDPNKHFENVLESHRYKNMIGSDKATDTKSTPIPKVQISASAFDAQQN